MTARAARFPLGLLLLALLLAGAGPGGARAQTPAGATTDDVRLVRADREGVSFEVDVPEPVLLQAGRQEDGLQGLEITGWDPTGPAGAPGIPERVVWIGIPEGARLEILGTGLDAVEFPSVRLAPRLAREPLDSRDLVRSGGTLPAAGPAPRVEALLAQPGYQAGSGEHPVAEVAAVTGMRSQTVAGIRLRPVTYDAATGRLRVYRHLAVTVRFVGGAALGPPAPREPAWEPVYRAVLVNAESARAFRHPLGARLRAARAAAAAAAGARAPARITAAPLGFDAATHWVKVGVDTRGIQRVTGDDLQGQGISLATVDPSRLRLFTRAGVPLLPEGSYCDTCGLSEVAIRVVGGEDGRFDPGDFVLFYGLPASAWQDEFTGPGNGSPDWLDHPYETRNDYWLTWDASVPDPPRRWTSRDVSPVLPGAWSAPFYSARTHFEQDSEYRPNMFDPAVPWDQWAWAEFTDALGTQVWLGDAPGAVTTEPAELRVRFWGQSQEVTRTPDIADHYLDVSFNDVPLEERVWSGRVRQEIDTTAVWIRATGNRLTARCVRIVDANNPARRDRVDLLFWELHFKRRFQAVGDVAQFASPDTTGAVGYGVAPFSSSAVGSLHLLDVSDPNSPVELTGWVTADTTGGKAVYFHDPVARPLFYYAAGPAAFRHPAVALADVRNLRAPGQGADYLVIAYDALEPQAERLTELRSRILPDVPGARTAVVRISDVLAWYSGGRMDPTAVRNFLYDLSTSGNWSPVPSYVCFLGDASYDFKNILHLAAPGQPAALVPSHVHGYFSGQFMTDDWLADLDLGPIDPPLPGLPFSPSDIPDFFIGRLPAASPAEASVLVDGKIVPYDEHPTFGEWRDRALLVADDYFQGFNPDGTPRADGLWGVHMYQSEQVDKVLPPELDRQKVYLIQYPFGVGAEKPGANADVKKWVNAGSLLWNFVGHGNPFKMADENAFIISDVAALDNIDQLTFLIAASCDVGKFDDPVVQGLGEALVKSPAGGTVASFSSSDIAFSSQNSSLNLGLLQQVFTPSAEGYELTLGQASYLVKRRTDASANDRKYTLQGDPATRLGSPQLDVRLALFDDESGAPLGDSLPRGRRVRVEGEVRSSHDTTTSVLRTDFNGTATLLVTDSAPLDTFTLYQGDQTLLHYTYNPATVFHGDLAVAQGRLTGRFYVPMEAALGPRAKARVYVENGSVDGVGARDQNLVDGSPSEVDTTGPHIDLRFVDTGSTVGPGAELRIALEDEHGIDVTGHSLPNAITVTIDDQSRVDVTDQFRYDPGSYTRGTILYPLPALTSGIHVAEVSAADNFAQGIAGRRNRSRESLQFTLVAGGYTPAPQVMNFPNPFPPGSGTQFVVNNLATAADLEIRVYAVDGTLVRALRATGGPGQAQVAWDGRDAGGGTVANGVYLYRIQVLPIGGAAPFELTGRAAAVH